LRAAVNAVHVVVPDGIDDPARPSGGNTYDRRVCRGLAAAGWDVCEHAVAGTWPAPNAAACDALRTTIAAIPDGARVLIDGLIASTAPDILIPESDRLSLVVLVHMPLDTHDEGAVLSAAAAIVTTSHWTKERLLERYALRPDAVHVAVPGVDPAAASAGTATGGELLCVAAVTPHKGHDVMLEALMAIVDRPWRCVCVGSLDRDPHFVERLRRQAQAGGITGRVDFRGPRTGAQLEAEYATADVLVLASRGETYGMVVTEALARGLPVIATAVGGLPEALGRTVDGRRPGLLVPPDDPGALATVLASWLRDAELRQQLRHAAGERRRSLPGWSTTAARVAQALVEAGAVRR
jgi:glycosyltransferase involved in cell wall biosynthesis